MFLWEWVVKGASVQYRRVTPEWNRRNRWESSPQPVSLPLILRHVPYKAPSLWRTATWVQQDLPGKREVSCPQRSTCLQIKGRTPLPARLHWLQKPLTAHEDPAILENYRRFMRELVEEAHNGQSVPQLLTLSFSPLHTEDVLQFCLHGTCVGLFSECYSHTGWLVTVLQAVSCIQPQRWQNFATDQV